MVYDRGDGRISTRAAYAFNDPPSLGLDHEVSQAGVCGEMGLRVRELVREICGQHDVQIIKGHVSKDHVHLFVSIPPQVTISRLVQRLKGKTAYKMLQEFAHLRKQFWGRHLWAGGTFAVAAAT